MWRAVCGVPQIEMVQSQYCPSRKKLKTIGKGVAGMNDSMYALCSWQPIIPEWGDNDMR